MTRSFFEAAGCIVSVTLIVAALWNGARLSIYDLNLFVAREALVAVTSFDKVVFGQVQER